MAWEKKSRRRGELPSDWPAIRKRVIARDVSCVLCGNYGNHVDHIDRFGPHELWNLRLLCEHCHMKRTGKDGARARRRGFKPKRKWDKWQRRGGKHPGLK